MSRPWSLSVIIPAFNEAETIGGIVRDIRRLDEANEILVIDDGSTDGTSEIAERAGATVIRHPYNIGNGASVKTGIREATGDVLLFMDGDGQHDPADIPRLLNKMNDYDMVVGARTKEAKVSAFRSLGNWGLIKIAEHLSGHSIPDLTSGFRAFHRNKILRFVHLLPNRYSYPTTSIMAFLQAGHTIHFEPLSTIRKRQGGKSHIRPFKDGFRFINIILRIIMMFAPQKIFMPASAAFLTSGGGLLGYNLFYQHNINDASIIVITVGTFTFFFGLLADQVAHIRRELGRFTLMDLAAQRGQESTKSDDAESRQQDDARTYVI
jgi:glycosyltransferase involved in cell wall biosynthesis